MRKTDAFRRAAALMAALSITVSLAAPAFAGTYYIDYGDITITKNADGSQTVQYGKEDGSTATDNDSGEIIITTRDQTPATQESDLEGPAAEDSDFGPVVEDNYQPAAPAQPEDADQPEGADQQKDADQPENADQQESADQQKDADQPEGADQPENTDRQEDADQPKDTDQPESAGQQAAPAAAPVASTPVKYWKNTITVINKCADKVLNLTLKDVKIDVSDTGSYMANGKAALSVKGNVEIELDGDNELKSGAFRAGLEKNTSAGTLTLKDDKEAGSGSLKATGGKYGAGIGGGQYGRGKNITIKGGTVTARGGEDGAGIGGGEFESAEAITITGGRVTATGGEQGAGIGGGRMGIGQNITITSGTVTAAGGQYGAGIGGGAQRSGQNIKIYGGRVTATGGENGAGIGGGYYYGNGEDITITGGTVTARGGENGAGIGGGAEGSGQNITITSGTVTAGGGSYGAGIGGGGWGSGENITITGGTVTATGGSFGAGIGGGKESSGSNVTVSGAAQVTATAGKSNGYCGAGATIGSGGNETGGQPVDGEEIRADIRGVTTGYIHHIIYNQDGSLKREWWEPERPQPTPEDPNAPAEESNEVSLGTPGLHVETLEGDPLPFDARQQGSTLRVTSDTLAARLHGTRQALEALREQGVEQIQFVTSFKTTTLSVEDLLAEGGSWFALEHNGLVSRQLSVAQAESLKCRMR